ncbi:MAG TPA: 30S ribosome-binding factor RbfA [Candidatus Limnocylindrales bacterium]|jgi:ribosome-binding factor A|nr:30S ribosome-binding factor RbfA [Candidatus Limnocylindrales bacterium]
MSERSVRVDELLREEISRILTRDVDDPRIGFLTVTRVEVTPDLRNGTVWASVIGQPAERRRALRALQGAMPFVRGRLGSLRLRRIPELRVRADETATRGTRVLELLRDLETGTEPSPTPPPETLPTPASIHGRSQPSRRSRR